MLSVVGINGFILFQILPALRLYGSLGKGAKAEEEGEEEVDDSHIHTHSTLN